MVKQTGSTGNAACSLCGKTISNPADLTVDSNGDYFCGECIASINCQKCGKELTITKKRVAELGSDIVCKGCAQSSKDSKSSSRRKYLIGASVLAVSGLAKAANDGYFTGVLGQKEPDLEETQELYLDDKEYYAERFEAPVGAILEYELTVVSGGIGSRLYTNPEYEIFKQAVEENSRFDQGNYLEDCSVGIGAGNREFRCELPEDSEYSIVFLPFVSDDNQGVLTYRVYS